MPKGKYFSDTVFSLLNKIHLYKSTNLYLLIMNTSKVFGFILALHVGVISVLFIQPGCQSSVQAPTQSDYQMNSLVEENAVTPSELNLAYQELIFRCFSAKRPTVRLTNEGITLEEGAFTVSVNESNLATYTIQSGDTCGSGEAV